MGQRQTLSEPITQKETSKCKNEFLKVGASCMQGWRISMCINIVENAFFFVCLFLILMYRYGRCTYTNIIIK